MVYLFILVMSVNFQYLMHMSTDVSVIFKNDYGYGYSSTLPLSSVVFIIQYRYN